MVANYLKIAWRNLTRNPAFSVLNILGLALGIGCSMLIALWVQDELATDAYHANGDYLYSVYSRRFSDGQVEAGHFTPGPLAEEIKLVIPEIQYSAGFDHNSVRPTFKVGEKTLSVAGNYAGPDFFKMFSYPLLEGTAETALANPAGIAISRKMAETLFGGVSGAVGKLIQFNNNTDVVVTAVFEDLPVQTSEKFEFLLSWKMLFQNIDWLTSWVYNRPHTFIMLRRDADPVAVEAKLKRLLDHYNKEQTSTFHVELGLQRFDEKYLYSVFKNGYPAGGRIEYVRLFSLVGIFILSIACINFMNLSTARSVKRAKEVGVRKVVGAARVALVSQFTAEALLVTFCSLLLAFAAVAMVIPAFNDLTGKQIVLPIGQPSFWARLFVLFLVTGLIAGSYPALFLSSLNPARVLKSALKISPGIASFRKALVVFQFVLSMALIVGTLVVSQQINYVQTKNLGFDRENLVCIPFEGNLASQYHLLKQEALRLPGVLDITRMSRPPARILDHGYDLNWEGRDPDSKTVVIHAAVGYDFVKSLHLELLAGRDYSEEVASDSSGYLVNETALKRIGYTDPIGKPLSLFGSQGKIIGLIKDFHFNSLRQPIEPLIVRFGENISWGYAVVRIEGGKTEQALPAIEKVCKQLNPNFPFNFYFTDDEYTGMYRSEMIVGKLASGFAFLAIFISCLGLLGLVMFTAEQATKEIGIRKVLGASVIHIVGLLSTGLVKLVVFSAIIAFPLAWAAMQTWLESFAYRTEIGWQVFAWATFLSLLLAVATISFHSIRAALANPVRSLRSE